MTLGNEQEAYKRLFEEKYRKIPLLSRRDIKRECGMVDKESGDASLPTEVLQKYVVEAIKHPDWLLVPKFTHEHQRLKSLDLPRARNMNDKGVDMLLKLRRDKSDAQLLQTAKGIVKNDTAFVHGEQTMDIIARAYELMGKDFPNLMFCRGADFDFDVERGFMGVDFAPSNLPNAMSYAISSFGKTRKYPVVAMVTFAEVARLYTHGHIFIGTENNWSRQSIELHFNSQTPMDNVVVRRMPKDPKTIEHLKKIFTKRAIKMQSSPDILN